MSIFDVSKYILKKCGPMSTWKLQKLCYYSQAWTLAWGEKPLFDEDFQAWANGPVCPELFFAYKGMFIVNAKNAKGDADALSAEQKENIDIVLKTYGGMEAYHLREQTHAEAPWQNARGELKEYEKGHHLISKDSMGEYYGSL